MGDSDHITIPGNIEGLEQALEKVLEGEDKLLEEMREKLLHARIRHEYRVALKKKDHPSHMRIKEHLSKKYFNTATAVKRIENILYFRY